MPSQLKSDTARTNGAKSRGPVTPEGRAHSSHNAVRHGLTAKSVVLPTESTEQFQLLLDSYTDQFHPQTPVETELVETMAAARWRLCRICGIETNLFSTELVRRAEDIDAEFTDTTDDDRLAWVFQKLADNGQALSLLTRYESALNRSYDRAFKQLHVLQRSVPDAPPTPTGPARKRPPQNEPSPPSTDPPALLIQPPIPQPLLNQPRDLVRIPVHHDHVRVPPNPRLRQIDHVHRPAAWQTVSTKLSPVTAQKSLPSRDRRERTCGYHGTK